MGKLVVLELRKSESDHNFEVILEIGEDGERPSTRITGTLPPLPEISTQYTNWQLAYRNLDLRKRLEIKVRKDPQETIQNCRKSAEIFQEKMKAWYDCQEFTRIRETLLNKLNELDEIRLIIQTNDSQLRRLPWHLFFERFLENYRKAEVALSPPEYERPEKTSQDAIRKKVRLLAVLGNSTGINIETDRQLLEKLPDAETVFLAEPQLREINDQLWDEKGWDILFFAGHSSSQKDGETGRIYINQSDSLSLNQLKYALVTAIEKGLTLAIFNSCDGLGLARELAELHIPQIIVMREPVPDGVAQEFLKYFLSSFSSGKSLYLAAREARERLHGLEDQFPCATWLPVICQHPAELPITWQQLQGIQPEFKSVDNFQDQSYSKTLAEFVPSGFDLLDERFFQTQGQRGESRLLKLREATWSLIIQGNYIDRDQQEELLNIAEELAECEGISLLLIRGEPGAGKTALMRWLVYQLFRQGHLILQKKAHMEDLNWLEALQEFSEQIGEQHFYVISDDIFRDELILDELEENQIQLPFTLIGTTRLNEDHHETLNGLGYVIEILDANRPSDTEKTRIIDKVCEDSAAEARLEDLTEKDKKCLMAAPTMLVLMLQLSEGKTFSQTLADIIKKLPNTDNSPIYHVFCVICSFFQYGIAVPPEIVNLCLSSDFSLEIVQDVLDLAERHELAGLINTVSQDGYEGLTTIHELIAKTAIDIDYRPRKQDNNPYSSRALERYLLKAIQCLDINQDTQIHWANYSLNRLAVVGETKLVLKVVNDHKNKIQFLQNQGTITALLIWSNIYSLLGLIEDQNRCINSILLIQPGTSTEWLKWLSLLQKLGNETQKTEAINKYSDWLKSHPATILDQEDDWKIRNKYLSLIKKSGTLEQKKEVVYYLINWLKLLPEYSWYRSGYLKLISKIGEKEQIENAIEQTVSWLQIHTDNRAFRLQYLRLIEKIGTPKQQQDAIKLTAIWLQEHSNSQYNRIQYLQLVERLGTLEQQEEAIDCTAKWIEKNPDNWKVYFQYLRLMWTLGKAEPQKETIHKISIWLEKYGNGQVGFEYLKLIKKLGTLEKLQEAISESVIWLHYPVNDCVFIIQYLKFIKETGIDISNLIKLTLGRLKEYYNKYGFHIESLIQYLKIVKDIGTNEENEESINLVIDCLNVNPNIEQHYYFSLIQFIKKIRASDQQKNALKKIDSLLKNNSCNWQTFNIYLILVQKQGTTEQKQIAIQKINSCMKENYNNLFIRTHYLKLIAQFGTPQEQQEAIHQTASWLENNDDWSVRTQYLLLLNKQGTPQQQQEAIKETTLWLEEHPDDTFVRTQYIDLIRKKGTPEQQQEVIEKIAIWLEQNPNDWRVRARYLTLIETLGNIYQQQAAIQQTTLWLKDNPKGLDNQYLRNAYLGLIKYQGTVEQQQEATIVILDWLESCDDWQVLLQSQSLVKDIGTLEQYEKAIQYTNNWVESHPEQLDDPYIVSQYLSLIHKQGTPEQQKQAIALTVTWLENHREDQDDSYILDQYLVLVLKQGTPQQKQQEIEKTVSWLQKHDSDRHVRSKYLELVLQQGTFKQQQEAISQSLSWLQNNPDNWDDSYIRTPYVDLLKKHGTKQQQQDTITQIALWLETHPHDSANIIIRSQYLELIKSQATKHQQEQAITLIQSWLQQSEELDSKPGQSILLNNLGWLLQKLGKINEAEEVFRRSQFISENLKDKQSLGIALNSLGRILKQQQKLDEAERVLRHSYDLSVERNDQQGQAIILNDLGQVIHQQRQKEEFNLALMYFRKSIEIGIQIDDQEHLAKVYTAIGQALLTNRETEEAIKYLIQGFEIDERLKNIRGLEIVTKKLTQALKRVGRLAEAINYYERAMVVSPKNQYLLELYNQLSSNTQKTNVQKVILKSQSKKT